MRRSLLALGFAFLAACTASSSQDSGDLDGADGADAGSSPAACTPQNVATTIFRKRCTNSACHDASSPAAGINFSVADVSQQVAKRTSKFCAPRVIVVPGKPADSYLLEKLTLATPSCGAHMPKGGGQLSAEELNCLTGWITSLPPTAGDGGGGGGEPGPGDTGW